MAYPPQLPPSTRTDSTISAVNHAQDHNKIAAALKDLLDELGASPSGSYANLTERLLGVAAGVDPAAITAFVEAQAAAIAARNTTVAAAASVGYGLLPVTGGTDTLPEDLLETDAGYLVGRTYTEATVIETTLVPVTLPAGDYVWRWDGFAWDYRVIDGFTSTVETTLPTAGTLFVVASTESAALEVDGAMDATGLHPEPYSFRIYDSVAETWSPWTAWQAADTYSYAGLVSSRSYGFQHRARDVFGNVKEGLAVTTTTAPLYTWANQSVWSFTAADFTDLNGLAPTTGTGTMVAPASNPGATPPIYVNVMGNQGHFRAAGGQNNIKLTEAVAKDGRGLELDVVLHATGIINLYVDTNGAGSNYIGFEINAAGAISAKHSAAGATVYTPEPGAPTVVPDTATLKALFTKNTDGTCTGRLYVDGVLYGSLLSSGWTWQGKICGFHVTSNQVDSYIDNLKTLSGTVV